MDHQTREILDMLTCQVCWATLTGRIFRCKFEHLLCEDCVPRLSKCPTCRGTLRQKLRSLSMEQVADVVRVPCDYSDVGCPELLPLKTKRQHEQTCPFGPGATSAQCPLVYWCPWVGSRAAVEQHVRWDHGEALIAAPDGYFAVPTCRAAVLEFDSALFVVRTESVTTADFTSHYVHVGHVAQGLRAEESRYRFKVRRDPDGEYFKGKVTDYRQPLQELAVAGDCLFFVTQTEQIGEESFSGTIKKVPIFMLSK